MPRPPKLRKKKSGGSTYWFTQAGGETYFGNVRVVQYSDARQSFNEHVKSLGESERGIKRRRMTAGELMDLFLAWIKKNRSERTWSTRKGYGSRFGSFRVTSDKIRIQDLPANRIRGADLEEWLARLEKKGLSPQTRRHVQTSIKHCWNWATKHPSPTQYLPPTFRPFSSVERTYVPPKTLTEIDLITDAEVNAIFAAAAKDLDEFHRFGPKRPQLANPYSSFADLLRCYYPTGARTDELASCEVGDVLFRTKQVVLGRHKRSRTQRIPTVRHITLNDEALEIFKRNSRGKQLTGKVFLNSDSHPWNRSPLPKRFERVKEVAATLRLGNIRDEITIYSFRDLWISEMLMAGNDVSTVARMAGTSLSMIERVYGHFRNDFLQEAQHRLDISRKQRRA